MSSTAAVTAPAAGYTIHVAGLAPETTEARLHDFFSFCGKLVSVKKTGDQADIAFEKLSAMRTSLMLNGGTLDGGHLEVTSASEEPKIPSALPTGNTGATPIGSGVSTDISQEDKPKAAIIAEYLAHGYVMGDHVIQRAIDFDHKQGISNRFLTFFGSLDHSVGHHVVGEDKTVSGKINESAAAVMAKTREVDQNRGVSKKFTEYYNKVVGTPVGQRVQQFYTNTQKQVLDVHEEAKRIADEKKRVAGEVPSPPTTASGDVKTAEAPIPGTTAASAPVGTAPAAAVKPQ